VIGTPPDGRGICDNLTSTTLQPWFSKEMIQGAQVSKNALQLPISKDSGTDTRERKSPLPAAHDTIDSGLFFLCNLLLADKSEAANGMQATSVKIAILFMGNLTLTSNTHHLILAELAVKPPY